MLKTWSRHLQTWMEKWGYALMCVLCAVVILLSALWTRDAQREERRSADALSGMDETLTDKKADKEAGKEAEKENTQWARPVKGDIARPFSVNTVYFEETGIYAAHMAVDFVCEGDASVYCMKAGVVVLSENGEVRIRHGDAESVYRGLKTIVCREGQQMEGGDLIGTGGGHVPFEGEGHVCVSVVEKGLPADFAMYFP